MVGSKQDLYRVQSETQVSVAGHSMIQLMLAVEVDSEDEDVEEALAGEKALAMVADQSLVTNVEF